MSNDRDALPEHDAATDRAMPPALDYATPRDDRATGSRAPASLWVAAALVWAACAASAALGVAALVRLPGDDGALLLFLLIAAAVAMAAWGAVVVRSGFAATIVFLIAALPALLFLFDGSRVAPDRLVASAVCAFVAWSFLRRALQLGRLPREGEP